MVRATSTAGERRTPRSFGDHHTWCSLISVRPASAPDVGVPPLSWTLSKLLAIRDLFTYLVNWILRGADALDISFLDDDLETLCRDPRKQVKQLGEPGAKKLRTRLADLMAAGRMSDLVAGRPHPLKGDMAGQLALDLDRGRRLVFEPSDEPAPEREDGGVDWERVRHIRITFIGNCHD